MKKENSNLEWIRFSKGQLEFICEALSVIQEQFPDESEHAFNIKESIEYQRGNQNNTPEKKGYKHEAY